MSLIARLERLHAEGHARALDLTSEVDRPADFQDWSLGCFQHLISHEMLLCLLPAEHEPFARVECFSALPAGDDFLLAMQQTEAPRLQELHDTWRARPTLPLLLERDDPRLAGSQLAWEMDRHAANRLLAHGVMDAQGESAGFYLFLCDAARMPLHQVELLELMLPALHAALMRAERVSAPRNGKALSAAAQLTPRESEVLRWIGVGKSNIEIGMILGISPLTVKNHVQEILRRLDVLNRTQAVSKAISLRLIRPL